MKNYVAGVKVNSHPKTRRKFDQTIYIINTTKTTSKITIIIKINTCVKNDENFSCKGQVLIPTGYLALLKFIRKCVGNLVPHY